MFIKSLYIKNFRSFDSQGFTIPIDENITAFIGKNGSGKTTVLDALNFLLGQDYLPTKISEKDFHSQAKGVKETDAIIIEAETFSPFFIEVDVISDRGIPASVIVPCNKVKLSIKRREKADRVLDDPYIINKTVIPIQGNVDASVYENKEFKKAYPISTLEEVETKIDDLDKAKEVIKDLLKGTATSVGYLDNFYNITYNLKSGDKRSASFPGYALSFNPNRIKNLAKTYYLTKDRDSEVAGNYSLISKILTDLHWRYKKRHLKGDGESIESEYATLASSLRRVVDEKGELIREINDKIKEVCSEDKEFKLDFIDIEQPYRSAFLTKQDNDKLLFPTNLGSGFNILIAYSLFSYVVNLEKIPIVLLIDEPELHLHCDWQKKMYNIFSNSIEIQTIYSTQSENFISLKNWRQIRLMCNSQLFPKKSDAQEEVQATDGEVAHPEKFLDDYAQKNLHISTILKENLELLFTQKCILVEGPSEKYALPKLLKLDGCDIETYSVSIIPAWGKTKIKNYQMICKMFGVAYFTVFDSDKTDDDESDNENSAIESNAHDGKIFKFSTNFENKLGVNGNNKFQKLVKKIDEVDKLETLDNEIKTLISNLKDFIVD